MVFWATWSPRSREVLADLERLRAEVGVERLAVIAVNVEHELISQADRDAIRAVVAETKSSATILLDEGLVAFNAFGTMAVPSSVVLDGRGVVTYALAGYPLEEREGLADAVRKALGVPTVAERRPPPEYVPANHALMYYNLGRLLLDKGQEEKAVEQFRIAVERDPGFKKPYVELGLSALRHGDAEGARAAFLKVQQIDPHDPEAAFQTAVAGLRTGRLDEAATIFEGLAAEYPDRGGYALGQAVTRKLQGREAEFRAALEKSRAVKPPEPRVIYALGAAAERRGDVPLAAGLYRQALEGALQ
jgi:Flp pilus assembly protein TadD